ncbi:MAG: aspartate-semialdehyde dehydrogenase, partial [Cyanobacteriota bacterium]|nr:aspartate-semialdehyde dehydrogenase [Cyanobacteriota bacterium]
MLPISFFPDRPLTVAVLGASGAVGQELLQLLQERSFPISELRLLASARSAGHVQPWNGSSLVVQEVSEAAF